jgi:hypothetical protein
MPFRFSGLNSSRKSAKHFSYRPRTTKSSKTKENIDVLFGVSEQWSLKPLTILFNILHNSQMLSIFPILMRRAALTALLLLWVGNSHAQWIATGAGPFNYDDTSNWKGGAINDQITNSPGAEQQTIVFTTDRTMPKGLLIKQPTDASDKHYPLAFKVENGEALTLNMGGPVVLDFGRTNDVTAFFGDNRPLNFDFGTGPAVFELLTGNSHAEIRGSILNGRGLIVRGGGRVVGGGRVTLYGGDSNVTDSVVIEGANLYLNGTASLPSIESLTLSANSTVAVQNETTDPLDQLPDSVPISCSGLSQLRLFGGRNIVSEETLGKVHLREGCLELWASAREGDTAVLNLTELVRDSDGILVIGYETPQARSRVKVVDDKILVDSLVGGRGAEGSTTASIVPWARGHGGGNVYAAAGFLTYSHDEGFRELDKEQEYVLDPNASKPEDNVRVAAKSMALSESKTINSLYFDPPTGDGEQVDEKELREGGLDLAGNTLTVSSGAISLTSLAQIANGTLTTEGDLPLIISGPVFMNAQLAGTGGLIYLGGRYPDLRLGNTENTLTGDYVITWGAIRLDSDNVPDSVTVRLHNNTELSIAGSETIAGLAGNGRVRFETPGRSLLVLGRDEGFANTLVVGEEGEIHPGDVSKEQQSAGNMFIWHPNDSKDYGSLNFGGGTLFIDVAEKSNDALVLDAENRCANVTGGTLRVNLLEGYKPKVGAKWKIIRGTVPATGEGFETVEDATGKGYKYSAKPVANDWVLELVSAPK